MGTGQEFDISVSRFDAADYLDNEEAQIAFINDAIGSGHPGYIANAIGALARAGNMSALARATGIKRQTLNKSLGAEGNPTLATLLPVLKELGLGIRVERTDPAEAAPKPKRARASSGREVAHAQGGAVR